MQVQTALFTIRSPFCLSFPPSLSCINTCPTAVFIRRHTLFISSVTYNRDVNMSSNKKHTLTLKEKVEIIELNEKQKVSPKELTLRFKCGKTQVYSTLQNKERILNEWLTENGNRRRKLKTTGNEKINEVVWEWFVAARAKNVPVSGPILQAQALQVDASLNITTFKASSGWLDSFKARHGIVWNQVCGEAKDTDEQVVSDWTKKLESLTAGYDPKNIFNCDETGLFYRALPTKTFALRGERCAGGKVSKDRLTVLLCGSMTGELEKPLVIGKSKKPRCFKNLKPESLPVIWRSSKKAWMTSAIMEEWLVYFNAKMARQKRKVLLFLDNAICHPNIKLSHVKLVFFPANTTTDTQPMDQGVIYTFKTHYRSSMLKSHVSKITSCRSINDIAKAITVLDAIHWIAGAVKRVRPDTVLKCFLKAGFSNGGDHSNALEDVTSHSIDERELIHQLCTQNDFPVDADSFIRVDDDLMTDYTFEDATELLQMEGSGNESDDGEEEAIEPEILKIQNIRQALTYVEDLAQFATHSDSPQLLQIMYDVRTLLETEEAKKKTVQPTLNEFWNT